MFINHFFSYFNKTLALHLVFSEQPLSLTHSVRARQYDRSCKHKAVARAKTPMFLLQFFTSKWSGKCS